MTTYYMLMHSCEEPIGEHEWHDEYKYIGIYSTEEKAKAAQAQVEPEFKNLPGEFQISEAIIGQTGWTEGYVDIKPEEM